MRSLMQRLIDWLRFEWFVLLGWLSDGPDSE